MKKRIAKRQQRLKFIYYIDIPVLISPPDEVRQHGLLPLDAVQVAVGGEDHVTRVLCAAVTWHVSR